MWIIPHCTVSKDGPFFEISYAKIHDFPIIGRVSAEISSNRRDSSRLTIGEIFAHMERNSILLAERPYDRDLIESVHMDVQTVVAICREEGVHAAHEYAQRVEHAIEPLREDLYGVVPRVVDLLLHAVDYLSYLVKGGEVRSQRHKAALLLVDDIVELTRRGDGGRGPRARIVAQAPPSGMDLSGDTLSRADLLPLPREMDEISSTLRSVASKVLNHAVTHEDSTLVEYADRLLSICEQISDVAVGEQTIPIAVLFDQIEQDMAIQLLNQGHTVRVVSVGPSAEIERGAVIALRGPIESLIHLVLASERVSQGEMIVAFSARTSSSWVEITLTFPQKNPLTDPRGTGGGGRRAFGGVDGSFAARFLCGTSYDSPQACYDRGCFGGV